MYIAIASFRTRKNGENLERMIEFVDRENQGYNTNKYFVIELEPHEFEMYKKSRSLQYCHPTIVYDPCEVGEQYIKSQITFGQLARTFGSRSGDH